jgi:quercetin dioxygenase-like cupin family protein
MKELADAWIEGDETARWRSGPAKVIEVAAGNRLPRHTDSADERIIVISGEAEVDIDGLQQHVAPTQTSFVPKDTPHEVRNAGADTLYFAALYADEDVTTVFEGGEPRRG